MQKMVLHQNYDNKSFSVEKNILNNFLKGKDLFFNFRCIFNLIKKYWKFHTSIL
jgi:hypothetical protein